MCLVQTIRKTAQEGLQAATGFVWRFWAATEVRTQAAEACLDRVEQMAAQSGDTASVDLARVARQAAGTIYDEKARLAYLQESLKLLAAGAAAGCGALSGYALAMHEAAANTRQVDSWHLQRADEEAWSYIRTHAPPPETTWVNFVHRIDSAATQALQTAAGGIPAAVAGWAEVALRTSDAQVRAQSLADIEARLKLQPEAAAQPVVDRRHRLLATKPSSRLTARLDEETLRALTSRSTPMTDVRFVSKVLHNVERDGEASAMAALVLDAQPPSRWLELRGRLEKQLPAACLPSIRLECLAALDTARPYELAPLHAILKKIGEALPLDASGVAGMNVLLDEIVRLDAGLSTSIQNVRNMANGFTAPELKVAVMREGLGNGSAVPLTPLSLALKLWQTLAPDQQLKLGVQVIEEIRKTSDIGQQAWLQGVQEALKLPVEARGASSFALQILQGLSKQPKDMAAVITLLSRAVEQVKTSGDRLRLMGPLLNGLEGLAHAAKDGTLAARCAILKELTGRTMYDTDRQYSGIYNGMATLISKQNANSHPLATWAANWIGRLVSGADAVEAYRIVLGELQKGPDADAADAARLLSTIAALPTAHSTNIANACSIGLNWLGFHSGINGDYLLAFGQHLMARMESNEPMHRLAATRALVQELQARAQRTGRADLRLQADFLEAAMDLPSAGPQSRTKAVLRALNAMVNANPPLPPGIPGIARLAKEMLYGDEPLLDMLRLEDLTLSWIRTMHESAGKSEGVLIVDFVRKAVQATDAENRRTLSQSGVSAIQALSQLNGTDPGHLADMGIVFLKSFGNGEPALKVGRALLEAMDSLGTLQQAEDFVQPQVALIRERMEKSAGHSQKQLEILHKGLAELSKLKGEAYHMARDAARGQKPDPQAKQVEQGEEEVIIGGVTVPKADE